MILVFLQPKGVVYHLLELKVDIDSQIFQFAVNRDGRMCFQKVFVYFCDSIDT